MDKEARSDMQTSPGGIQKVTVTNRKLVVKRGQSVTEITKGETGMQDSGAAGLTRAVGSPGDYTSGFSTTSLRTKATQHASQFTSNQLQFNSLDRVQSQVLSASNHRPIVARRESEIIWSSRSNTGGMPLSPHEGFEHRAQDPRPATAGQQDQSSRTNSSSSAVNTNYQLPYSHTRAQLQRMNSIGSFGGGGPGGTRSTSDEGQKPQSPELVRMQTQQAQSQLSKSKVHRLQIKNNVEMRIQTSPDQARLLHQCKMSNQNNIKAARQAEKDTPERSDHQKIASKSNQKKDAQAEDQTQNRGKKQSPTILRISNHEPKKDIATKQRYTAPSNLKSSQEHHVQKIEHDTSARQQNVTQSPSARVPADLLLDNFRDMLKKRYQKQSIEARKTGPTCNSFNPLRGSNSTSSIILGAMNGVQKYQTQNSVLSMVTSLQSPHDDPSKTVDSQTNQNVESGNTEVDESERCSIQQPSRNDKKELRPPFQGSQRKIMIKKRKQTKDSPAELNEPSREVFQNNKQSKVLSKLQYDTEVQAKKDLYKSNRNQTLSAETSNTAEESESPSLKPESTNQSPVLTNHKSPLLNANYSSQRIKINVMEKAMSGKYPEKNGRPSLVLDSQRRASLANISSFKMVKTTKYQSSNQKSSLHLSRASEVPAHEKQQFKRVLSQVKLLDSKGCDELFRTLQQQAQDLQQHRAEILRSPSLDKPCIATPKPTYPDQKDALDNIEVKPLQKNDKRNSAMSKAFLSMQKPGSKSQILKLAVNSGSVLTNDKRSRKIIAPEISNSSGTRYETIGSVLSFQSLTGGGSLQSHSFSQLPVKATPDAVGNYEALKKQIQMRSKQQIASQVSPPKKETQNEEQNLGK